MKPARRRAGPRGWQLAGMVAFACAAGRDAHAAPDRDETAPGGHHARAGALVGGGILAVLGAAGGALVNGLCEGDGQCSDQSDRRLSGGLVGLSAGGAAGAILGAAIGGLIPAEREARLPTEERASVELRLAGAHAPYESTVNLHYKAPVAIRGWVEGLADGLVALGGEVGTMVDISAGGRDSSFEQLHAGVAVRARTRGVEVRPHVQLVVSYYRMSWLDTEPVIDRPVHTRGALGAEFAAGMTVRLWAGLHLVPELQATQLLGGDLRDDPDDPDSRTGVPGLWLSLGTALRYAW